MGAYAFGFGFLSCGQSRIQNYSKRAEHRFPSAFLFGWSAVTAAFFALSAREIALSSGLASVAVYALAMSVGVVGAVHFVNGPLARFLIGRNGNG